MVSNWQTEKAWGLILDETQVTVQSLNLNLSNSPKDLHSFVKIVLIYMKLKNQVLRFVQFEVLCRFLRCLVGPDKSYVIS